MAQPTPSTSTPPGDRPGQALLFALAAGLLGQTLAQSNGHQDRDAMVMLTITLGITLVAVLLPRFGSAGPRLEQVTLGLVGAMLAWQFAMLMHNSPGIYLQPRGPWEYFFFRLYLALAGVLAGMGLAEKPVLGRWRMPLLLFLFLLLGVWLIKASPRPVIDVDLIQRESTQALMQFKNPFELTFQNIYGSTAFFGSNIADAQRINVGFPYPPLSLLLALPGQAIFGDYRYGQLAAMIGAAAFMAYSQSSRLSEAVATLFLFTPRSLFVLEQGWTDPYLVLLAAATVWTALHRPNLVPWAFGLLLVCKQYTALVLLGSWLLVQPFDLKRFGQYAVRAAGIATAVTLPFLLWNPKAFWFSVVGAHGETPFRPDALSFPAWLGGATDHRWGSAGLIALGVSLGLASWRSGRTPAGFAGALALIYFGFFSFGGHAFCNHYYFILGLISLAAAASKPAAPVAATPAT